MRVHLSYWIFRNRKSVIIKTCTKDDLIQKKLLLKQVSRASLFILKKGQNDKLSK